jgi:hypothetical protein
MSQTIATLLAGAMVAGHAVIGLFFLRFWTRSRDDLFLAFAAAFWLLALNQLMVAIYGATAEARAPLFLLRLAAFALILFAIIRKNMGRG